MAELNKIGDHLRSQLTAIWSGGDGPPTVKHGRVDKSASSDGSKRNASPSGKPPFSNEQIHWLGGAIGDSLTAFGGHVEARVKHVEDAVVSFTEKQEAHNKAEADRVLALEKETQALKEIVVKLQDQAAKQGLHSPGVSSAPATVSASSADIPYELRTSARIGSIGYDTPAADAEAKAKSILQKAGITEFANLKATRDPGSTVDLTFPTPEALSAARLAVRNLEEKFSADSRNPIWLDARKTRNELRPSRLTHKAFDTLLILEGEKHPDVQPPAFVKDMRGKMVKLGTKTYGMVYFGQWKWLQAATDRYTNEDLEWATAVVNNQ